MDRPTLETLLKRSLEGHSSLEHLAREKQASIQQTEAQLADLKEGLSRVRGALEYSGLTLKSLKGDLEQIDARDKAAKAAAEQAEKTRQPE